MNKNELIQAISDKGYNVSFDGIMSIMFGGNGGKNGNEIYDITEKDGTMVFAFTIDYNLKHFYILAFEDMYNALTSSEKKNIDEMLDIAISYMEELGYKKLYSEKIRLTK